MAEKEKKKKNNGPTKIKLPKAWASAKHSRETAQAKTDMNDIRNIIITVVVVAFVLFVILGGVSQTGFIKAIFNWSNNVQQNIGGWIGSGSIYMNDDGVYYDPTGEKGDKLYKGDVNNQGEEVNQ